MIRRNNGRRQVLGLFDGSSYKLDWMSRHLLPHVHLPRLDGESESVCVWEREIEREEGEKRKTENEEKGDRYKQTVELSKVPEVLGRCNSALVQIEPRSRDCFGNDLCLQGFLELPYQENLNQSEYNTRLVFWTHIGWKSGCCSRNSIFRLEVAFSWFWENSDFN